MEQTVIYLIMVQKLLNVKQKILKFVANQLCLGNISKDLSVDNIKNTGLNGYFYDFMVDCDAIADDDILDIHRYLMKKNIMI